MTKLAVTALLALSLTAPAMAQGMRDPAAIFDNADTDHDGKVSRAEFDAARGMQFDRLDRNHDGVISRDDFAEMIARRPEAGERIDRMIAQGDTNHDGKITRDEYMHAPSVFDRADTNHDGYVDQAELAALRAKIEARRQARDAGGNGAMGGAGDNGDGPPHP